MGSARFDRIRRCFLEARELSPDQREQLLDSACADDASIRTEIEAMLRADAQLGESSPSLAAYDSHPGTEPQIAGYQIEGKLGHGGMGVVWQAIQLGTHRRVALKTMNDMAIGSERRRTRFAREVELAANLQHPNIARVYDSGLDKGVHFYAMELIDGLPLDQFAASKHLDQQESIRLMRRVCQAMQYAHQRGVIHRDLKPSNILVDRDGQPHILDFGMAKLLSNEEQPALSIDGELAGTPLYMSPEQAAGKSDLIDTRTDVYALGVLLFRLVVGSSPHETQGSYLQVLRRVAEQDVRRPRAIRPDLDADIDAILLKALAHDPEERYLSAGELAEELRRYLEQEPINAQPATIAYLIRKRLLKHRAAALASLLVILSLLAIAVTAYVRVTMERTRAEQAAAQEEKAKNEAILAQQREADLRLLAEQRGRDLRQHLYESQMNLAGQALQSAGGAGQLDQYLSPWRQEPDLRGWEWYYLNAVSHQEVLTLPFHDNVVYRAVWNPDGNTIASSGADREIHICDAHTGMLLRILRGHASGVPALAWDRRGQRLVSGGNDGTVRIWDVNNGKQIHIFNTGSARVTSVDWNPAGTQIVCGCSGPLSAQVWDLQTGRAVLHRDFGQSNSAMNAAWSPDGARIVCATYASQVRIIDAKSGAELMQADNVIPHIRAIAWSSDGERLAWGGESKFIAVWDIVHGSAPFKFQASNGNNASIAWSPDGKRLAVGSFDGFTIGVWDSATGRPIQTLPGHAGPVNSVAWSPDNRCIASASLDRTVKIWDTDSPTQLVFKGHDKTVRDIIWLPDGAYIASVSLDQTVRIWPMYSHSQPRALTVAGPHWLETAAWSPDGKRLATAGQDQTIRIWDTETGNPVGSMKDPTGNVPAIAWNPDGSRLATSDQSGIVRVWDVNSQKELFNFSAHTSWVWAVAWSPDNKRIATGASNGYVKTWDASTGKALITTSGRHSTKINEVAWSPDNHRIAVASADGTADVWGSDTGICLARFNGHTGPVTNISWSPDGKRVVTDSGDGTIRIWASDTGNELLRLAGTAMTLGGVAWSHDGHALASSGNDNSVDVRDAALGYANERSPAIIPELARRLNAQPDNLFYLRLRAEAYANSGDLDRAAADVRGFLSRTSGAAYQTGWWIAGPFPHNDTADLPSRLNISLTEISGDTGALALKWRSLPLTAAGVMDPRVLLPAADNSSIYAMSRIYALKPAEASLVLRCKSPCHAWLNQHPLPTASATLPSTSPSGTGDSEPAPIPITLNAGWNTLIVQVTQSTSMSSVVSASILASGDVASSH